MARALALFFWLFAISTFAAFLIHPVWLPELASAAGVEIDQQISETLLFAGGAFLLAQILLGTMLWRFGSNRPGPASHVHENPRLEIVWTTVTAIVFVGLGIQGSRIYARSWLTDPPADSLPIEITGQQFAWNVRYAGPDGKFGRTRPDDVNDSEGNFIGLDDRDPASADDITLQNVVAVPVNKPIKLIVRSRDVLHSFFVPALRFKQDAVPGLAIPVQFTATKIGEYEVACAELCGMQHYKMRARMLVMSAADFDKWLIAHAGAQ